MVSEILHAEKTRKQQKNTLQNAKKTEMKNNRRGLWGDFITSIFIIAAITLAYIITQQVYEYDIKPYSVAHGSDTTNMNYIDLAWSMWPIPVMIGFVFMLLKSAKDRSGVTEIGDF